MNEKQRLAIEDRLSRLRRVMALSESTRALTTEQCYVQWIRRFLTFCFSQPDRSSAGPVELARRFVESHARMWAVATQDQFRNALVFYFKHVVQQPIGDLGTWAGAKRPKRLPVWLAHEDMMSLLSCMRGEMRLMAEMGYGSGLRSHELAKLRWKDIDWNGGQIVVRAGKGEKDRVTFLPQSILGALREQEERMRRVWESDRRNGRAGVEVPSPKFDGTAWPWFWVWAANSESVDPRSGVSRRHHLHRSTLGKALAVAVRVWGGNQRVTVHSLRHSFATQMLQDGLPIQELQALLGHADITTTQIYAHCLPRLTSRRNSPLDRVNHSVDAKVIDFPSQNPDLMRRAASF